MDHTQPIPELPRLESGIQLLEAPQRAVGPLQTLVLDHILMESGNAVWIDAHNYGTSVYLADVAPSPRVLDRIHIARGFTSFQHHTLVQDAVNELTSETSMIVAPAVDALYRSDDVRGNDPQEMLLQGLSRLANYARRAEIPVLTTRVAADSLSAPIERVASDVIEVEQTKFGPRFLGNDFETLVYNTNGGQTMQTTLAYWARILRARQPAYEQASQSVATTARP